MPRSHKKPEPGPVPPTPAPTDEVAPVVVDEPLSWSPDPPGAHPSGARTAGLAGAHSSLEPDMPGARTAGLAGAHSSLEPDPLEALDFAPHSFADVHLIDGFGAVIRPPSVGVGDLGWGLALRRFARAAVWALPAAAVCFALGGMWGWPTAATEPAGKSPGTWLVVTLFGLILSLAGVVALAALLSYTPARPWSLFGLVSVLIGTVLLAPVLGVVGLARPSVTRVAGPLPAGMAADLESRFFEGAVSRWLGVGGMALLVAGWVATACAVLASGVLNRVDGYLLGASTGVAVLSAYLAWQFLIVIAAMLLLAAGLGLAWTASRLTPDGARDPADI